MLNFAAGHFCCKITLIWLGSSLSATIVAGVVHASLCAQILLYNISTFTEDIFLFPKTAFLHVLHLLMEQQKTRLSFDKKLFTWHLAFISQATNFTQYFTILEMMHSKKINARCGAQRQNLYISEHLNVSG